MRYFKTIQNGYIQTIGTGEGGIEISGEEYKALHAVFMNRPTDAERIYELNAENLEWEQTGIYAGTEEELSDAEALAILLGGAV